MYQELIHPISGDTLDVVLRLEDLAYVPCVEGNTDFAEYQAWLARGNTPLAAGEQHG